MNYGVDNIIAKVMTDNKATDEMTKSVMDILRIATKIEEAYAEPPVTCDKIEHATQEIPVEKTRYKYTKYTINGETKTMEEWCKEYGMCRSTVEKRIYQKNMSIEEALTKKTDRQGNSNKVAVIEYDRFGKQIRRFDSINRAARELQISYGRVNRALRMSPDDQLSEYGYYLMTA